LKIFVLMSVLIFRMPPISRDYNTHCRCLQVESRIIPPDSLKSIKIVPEGTHCPATEVIAGLTSGENICLNPRSAWVKRLIQFVLDKQLQQQGGNAPKQKA
uniref:Chemokine (C-X-C motif) ligand 19 n=1 Tax=Myripristis murdjan TaxID=586833 RepID=A0A667YRS5_9TELE